MCEDYQIYWFFNLPDLEPFNISPLPLVINHSLYFPVTELRIPLQLDGIISYLSCWSPTIEEWEDESSYIFLTPMMEKRDPNVSTYSYLEESMVNHKGGLKESNPRKLLSEVYYPVT